MIRGATPLLASGVALLLAACATPPKPIEQDWPERREALQSKPDFALVGRVAIVAAGEGVNASMRWTQSGDRAVIALDGPLGIGGAQIEVEGEHLQLRTARGEQLDGEAARAELQRRLGFELPVGYLRYWLRGVPAPLVPAEETLQTGASRLASLGQDGWSIVYPDYMDSALGPLPRRLNAQRGEARVKIVVDRWKE